MFFWILIGYLSLLIILARVFSKKIDGLNEFFLASRNLPAWVATATFVASWIGAASTIGTIDKAFSQGLSAFWYMAIPSALSLFVITFVFARRVNRIQALSMPQAFEGRYGATAGFFLSSVILFASVTLLASQLVAAGQLIHTAADIPVEWATWLTLAVIVIYSVIGGFRAVVMTDVFQVALLGLGLFILFAFSMWVGWPHMEAGVNAMIAGAVASAATHVPAEVAHEALVDPTQFWNPFVELPKHLMITATFILGWCIAPEMWQRMQAVANPDDALKVGLGSIASTMLLFLAIVFTGISAVGALHHLGITVQDGQNVLFVLAQQLPNPFLMGLVLLGGISAVFSTIDSSINISSLTLSHDMIQRYLWPRATEQQLVLLSRVATVLVGIPSVAIALHFNDIIQVLWISADIYASTIFVPVVALFYCPQAPRSCGVWAIALGLIPVVFSFIAEFTSLALPPWWPEWPYTTLLGVSMSVLGFVGAWAAEAWLSKPMTINQ